MSDARLTFGSVCSGIEAASVAWEPLGWKCAWVSEIDPFANAVLAHRFPSVPNLGDFTQIGVTVDADPIDLLVGGTPCFAAGTMVLTERGHIAIESVAVGDRVLTHTGRWRPVTAVGRKWAASTLVIRGHGFPDITTTAEHPFWAKQRTGTSLAGGARHRLFDAPNWRAARAIEPGTTYLSQVLPVESAECAGADVELQNEPNERRWANLLHRRDGHAGARPPASGADFWWLVGRYLADGWRRERRGRATGYTIICAGKHEADALYERIERVFHCSRAEQATVVKFQIAHRGFYEFLAQFGHLASGKRIPGWVYGLPVELAESLLTGYLSGDGSRYSHGWKCTTVSRALALGVALLAQRARNIVASVHDTPVADRATIEGRAVRQRWQYGVVFPHRNRSAFVEGQYGWKLVRSVTPGGPAEVFNLSVEEDESYTADGVCVHNCTDYSIAGDRAGMAGDDGRLALEYVALLDRLRPHWMVWENVPGVLSSNGGRDFGAFLGALGQLGYGFAYRVLDAQFFGVPQRRRRVFVVGCLGDWRAPAAVLLERHSLSGHPAPRREAGQRLADTLTVGANQCGGGAGDFVEVAGEPAAGVTEFLPQSSRVYLADGVAPTLQATGTRNGNRAPQVAYGISENQRAELRLTPYVRSATGGGGKPGQGYPAALVGPLVRRLTPRECERLQGFPDDWTLVPYRGKPADGPRYRALGNSMAVPVVRWIGERIQLVEALLRANGITCGNRASHS